MQYDKELVLDTLEQIRDALVVVEKRCSYAKEADDFCDIEEGYTTQKSQDNFFKFLIYL